MDGIVVIVVMLMVVALVFMVFVVPVWIVVRGLEKKRSAQTVANDEHTERLAEAEVAMRDRIAALESILDAETPNWRQAAGQDGASG